MRIQSTSALLLVAIAGVGCGRSSDGSVAEANAGVAARIDPPVPPIEVTRSHDGRSVDLDEVHLLKIAVPSHASTGKVWRAKAPGPRNLRLVKEVFLTPKPDIVGAPDTQVLYFGATPAGAGTLELDYGKHGEAPVDHFTVTVRTKGAFTGEVGPTNSSATLGGTFSGSGLLTAPGPTPGLLRRVRADGGGLHAHQEPEMR